MINSVSKSLFGAPNDEPNNGMINVRNETGINCFREGVHQPFVSAIFFTAHADINTIPINIAKALPKVGGSSPIFTMRMATNVANNAPVAALDEIICFQFMMMPS